MVISIGKHFSNKRKDEFSVTKILRAKFGGLNIMKSVLSLDETPPGNTLLENLLFLAEDIPVKTREALQKTDLDIGEFLGTNKILQSIQGELLNNTSKLSEINKSIKRDTKKLQEVQVDPTYSDDQRQLYKDGLDDINTKKQARLEIVSQNRKDLQTKVTRIKKTLEEVLDKDASFTERIRTLS